MIQLTFTHVRDYLAFSDDYPSDYSMRPRGDGPRFPHRIRVIVTWMLQIKLVPGNIILALILFPISCAASNWLKWSGSCIFPPAP